MEPREDCFEGNQTARWEAVELILVTDDNDFGIVAVGMERNTHLRETQGEVLVRLHDWKRVRESKVTPRIMAQASGCLY